MYHSFIKYSIFWLRIFINFFWKMIAKIQKSATIFQQIILNSIFMQFDHHPFLQDHPELQESIQTLKSNNVHFAKLLREYEGICLEIGRAESEVPGYLMSDMDLEQLKKERLVLKDEMIGMIV